MYLRKGGDYSMVEETIQVIRDTEAEADAMVEDAQKRCGRLVEEASREADEFRAQQRSAMRQYADKAMSEAKEKGEQIQRQNATDIELEVRALKELAAGKEEQAVSLVLSRFV